MNVKTDEIAGLKDGIEKHVWPAGNGHGFVTTVSSDAIFGADGLGLSNTVWMRILSFLARTGIQEQTGSKDGETDIENCAQGWGKVHTPVAFSMSVKGLIRNNSICL